MIAGAAIVAEDDATEFETETAAAAANAAGFLEQIVETPVEIETDATSEAAIR